jgi:hypothetical protein
MDSRGSDPRPPLYRTRNGESSSRKARSYPGSFGWQKLGDELCETTPSPIFPVLEKV